MQTCSAAVIGASGYSGLELTRLLARHPRVRVTALTSDRWAGEAAGARLPLPPGVAALTYGPLSGSEAVDAEVAFLATPAEVSHQLAPKLLARGLKVIDLSGAFRLADAAASAGSARRAPAVSPAHRSELSAVSRTRGCRASRRVSSSPE